MESQRSFLLIGLVLVSFLLWTEWQKDYGPQPIQPVESTTELPTAANGVPSATPAPNAKSAVPEDITQQSLQDVPISVSVTTGERLEGAVPLICEAGDVIICNRQLVHGSFPNSGFEPRLTVNFGFHRRSSVFGVKGAGMTSEEEVYDEAIIDARSRVIGYAIDARRQKYPAESSYQYLPFAESGKSYVWDDNARQSLKDYNLHDLSI